MLGLISADIRKILKDKDRQGFELVCVSKSRYDIIKDNSKLFFHCAYASVSTMSRQCNDKWGYAVFDNEGHLLSLYGKSSFLLYCRKNGILHGTVWRSDHVGYNAVAKGLKDNAPCVSFSDEHMAPGLQSINIYFHPVSLEMENIKHDFYNFNNSLDDAKTKNNRIGLYGGIAVFAIKEEESPIYLTLAEATAREVSLQLFWHNAVSHDMIHNTGFISINRVNDTDKIMLVSGGIYEVLELPLINYQLHNLDEVIDPLPGNRELWTILHEHRIV